MSQLHLKTSQMIQGNFEPGPLNLLLVFQVNCPGCFLYALPLAAELHATYGDRLQVLGLSTAFEDFELNTAENTRSLVESGELVGVTRQYFQSRGLSQFSVPLLFPIAFDHVGQGLELFDDTDVERICQLDSQFLSQDDEHQAQTRSRVQRFLQQRPLSGYTFTVNQLRGTPSWIVFDNHDQILAEWFGHRQPEEVTTLLAQLLQDVPEPSAFAS